MGVWDMRTEVFDYDADADCRALAANVANALNGLFQEQHGLPRR
jgi:hypothetical protein